MFSIFSFYFWRLSLLFPWNDYANLIVRHPGSNQSGSRQVTHTSKGHMGIGMSSLGQNTVFLRTFSNYIFYSLRLCLLFPWNDYAIG